MKKWMPKRQITRGGQIFVYSGDTIKKMRAENREYAKRHGRKTVFVQDREDPDKVCEYVSAKFYPSLCKERYPTWGKESLEGRRWPTW